MPMYGQGRFEVMSPARVLAAVKDDGIPRYPVCDSAKLRVLLGEEELPSSDESCLVLRLDPSCFLYYMNSSASDADPKNSIDRVSIFDSESVTKESAREMLVDAEKGVSFSITRNIKKGEQLLHFFPTRENLSGDDGDGPGAGGGVASPPRRRTRRSVSTQGVDDEGSED